MSSGAALGDIRVGKRKNLDGNEPAQSFCLYLKDHMLKQNEYIITFFKFFKFYIILF